MALIIVPRIREKLSDQHQVSEEEICQCFANRTAGSLIDTRAHNKTDPDTQWFISETDFGRKLKVVFILIESDVVIKTAYEANPEELRIYYKHAK